MKTSIEILAALILVHLFAGCSCAIFGNTYQSATRGQRIESQMVERFAADAKFRKRSRAEFKRGPVYLFHEGEFENLRIQGSFCPSPWESVATSAKEVASKVEGAEIEAKKWFREHGVVLRLVPSGELIERGQAGGHDDAGGDL